MKKKYLEPQVSVDKIWIERNFLTSERVGTTTPSDVDLDVEDIDDTDYWN